MKKLSGFYQVEIKCTDCGVSSNDKPFYIAKSVNGKYYRRHKCKKCMNIYHNEKNKEYQLRNPEINKKRCSKYFYANRERLNKARRAYYKKHEKNVIA